MGHDGEHNDVLWGNAKPSIWVPQGSLIATTEKLASLTQVGQIPAQARLKLLALTPYENALGRLCVAQVMAQGLVELAGPVKRRPLAAIIGILRGMGADLVLADGAIDRVVSVGAGVSEGIILASGASLDQSQREVIHRTVVRVEQLLSPAVTESLGAAIRSVEAAVSVLDHSGSITAYDFPSVLGYELQIMARLRENTSLKAVLVQGALTDKLLTALSIYASRQSDFTVIVSCPCNILVSVGVWESFKAAGGKVASLDSVRVLAVTLNPCSPCGWQFDAANFLAAARQTIAQVSLQVPVYDVCQLE